MKPKGKSPHEELAYMRAVLKDPARRKEVARDVGQFESVLDELLPWEGTKPGKEGGKPASIDPSDCDGWYGTMQYCFFMSATNAGAKGDVWFERLLACHEKYVNCPH